MGARSPDVIVIGGGVIGLSIAYDLIGRGLDVRVFDAMEIERSASWAAGGMLGVTSELGGHGKLSPLARASLATYFEWTDAIEEASDCTIPTLDDGTWLVAPTEDDIATLERIGGETVSPAELPEGLCAHAVRWVPDGAVDNRALVTALREALIHSERADVQYGRRVDRIDVAGKAVRGVVFDDATTLAAPTVVLAAGAWSRFVGGTLQACPTRPVKGEMLRVRGRTLPRVVRFVGHALYLVPRTDGSVVVGATEYDADFDTTPSVGGVAKLTHKVSTLAPGWSEAQVEATWAGLRPGTPDYLPILGTSAEGPRGLVYATGHYRNGILLAPVTARIVGELVERGKADMDIRAFSPDRFYADRNQRKDT